MRNNEKKSSVSLVTQLMGVLLLVVGVALIGAGVWSQLAGEVQEYYEPAGPAPVPGPQESVPEPEEDYFYPVGVLYDNTPERNAYVDGDLQLWIPRLDLQTAVYNGVDDATLIKGVGLFDEAQLPAAMDVNSNTVLAGHRDVYNMEFYYIDTVELGDRIYLTYLGDLYTYEVVDQFITDAMDWSPVQVRSYPCVTLMSCHPIGDPTNRIFTVGRLIDVAFGADFPDEDVVPNFPDEDAIPGQPDTEAEAELFIDLEPDQEPQVA